MTSLRREEDHSRVLQLPTSWEDQKTADTESNVPAIPDAVKPNYKII